MKSLLLLLAFFTTSAFAGFEKFTVENLDIEYALPYGRGTVDRLGLGMSLVRESHEIEVIRTDSSFEVKSSHVDFSWINPIQFLHNLEQVTSRKTSASLGTRTHFVDSEYFLFRPKNGSDYEARVINGKCEGNAVGPLDIRLLEDCRKKMSFSIKKMVFPDDFILYRLIESFVKNPVPGVAIPADNIILEINEGDFALQFYMKYWFYAGLRSWGHVKYENDHKTIALRVDLIKFGYIPVTNIVMKTLKEIIDNPDVIVDPPWIRINLGKSIENK